MSNNQGKETTTGKTFSSKASENGSTLINFYSCGVQQDFEWNLGEQGYLNFMEEGEQAQKDQGWGNKCRELDVPSEEDLHHSEQQQEAEEHPAQQNPAKITQSYENQEVPINDVDINDYLEIRNESHLQHSSTKEPQIEDSDKKESSDKKGKNATKNIIKNFGRDLLSFVLECKKNRSVLSGLFADQQKYSQFVRSLAKVKKLRREINGICHLRQLWTDNEQGSLFRMISENYLRKRSLKYIFGSKVKAYKDHLEFKEVLRRNLRNPHNFNHLITNYL